MKISPNWDFPLQNYPEIGKLCYNHESFMLLSNIISQCTNNG